VATPAPLVRLFTTLDQFEAKVAVAKLGAEGIVCELRGGISSAYPFGPVHVYVELTRVDEAREILTVDDDGGDGIDFDGAATAERLAHRRARTRWVAVLGLLVVVAFGFARLAMML
jgi:hypothetical protein